MTIPSLILGAVLSTLFGALFHLVRGGGLGRLVLYLVLGWIGFWAGHALAAYFDWNFDRLGALHLGTASFFSVLFILAGHWLSMVEVQRN
jgi:uncharacterized membrane protein YeaQ/YmgE (transglycosylase-associated protein family)